PTPEELGRLWEWLKPHRGEDVMRCRLMTQRWLGDISGLRHNLTDEEQADPEFWFWTWCRQTLERRHGGAEQVTSEILSAVRGDETGREALADAELLLALPARAGEPEPDFERAEIEFQLAYHRADTAAMTTLLDDEGNRPL